MQPFRPFRKWTIYKTSFLQMLNIDSETLNLQLVSLSYKIDLELSYLEKKVRYFCIFLSELIIRNWYFVTKIVLIPKMFYQARKTFEIRG